VSSEENMALVRRFWEARVRGDIDAVDEMLIPDLVSHTKLLPAKSLALRANNGRPPNGTRNARGA
jgi:ketosteroid isomerase-like protein